MNSSERKTLYWPNLRHVAVLENAQLRFYFPYICLQFFPANLQVNVWKIKNATEGFLAQLHPSNLVNKIFLPGIFALLFIYFSEFIIKESYLPWDFYTNTGNLRPICQSTKNTTRGAIFLLTMNCSVCTYFHLLRVTCDKLYNSYLPNETSRGLNWVTKRM